jgi:hypothetical protein
MPEHNTVGHYHCEECKHGEMHVLDYHTNAGGDYLHQCKMCGHRQYYHYTYSQAWEIYGS